MGKIADISKWQGTINWSKASSELDLVIIRVQYGSTTIDSKYKEYVTGAKQYKIPFGHYAYALYTSVNDAIQEAKDFWARCDKNAAFYVVDVEEITTSRASDLVPATQAFIDYLHSQGAKKVGLYSGDSFYKTNNLSRVKADFLWIARYGVNNGRPSTKPSIACDLWQYTSTGTVSGISGDVDLNQVNGSKPLSYFTSSSVVVIPEPETPPVVVDPVPEEPEVEVPVEEEDDASNDNSGEDTTEEPPDDDTDITVEPPVEIIYDKTFVNSNSKISTHIVRNREKVANPQLFLANRRRTVIHDLIETYGKKLTINFTTANELSFSVPYTIDIQNKLVRNEVVDDLRATFLVKLIFAGVESWYVIEQVSKSMTDSDLLNVQCYSLEYELRTKKVRDYKVTSYNCVMVLNDILEKTNWKIGYVNDDFNLKYHQFDVSTTSVLDFINEICETFNAFVVYDTVNKKVNICKEEEVSVYKGFWIEYGKYLQTLEETVDMNDVVTRLTVIGADGVSINSVNPTGQSYIDDFSSFMYPFDIDEQGNIINSSYFMSDELCLALISYNKLVEDNQEGFSKLLLAKSTLQTELTELQNKLTTLDNELTMILDNIEVAKIGGQSTTSLIQQRNNKEVEINTQKNAIVAKETQITSKGTEITKLNTLLSIENNLSESLLEELNDYTYEEDFTDTNQINDADLYEAGIAYLNKVSSPPINISMGIVNFFAVLEESHNWNRLSIGDIIRVRHDKLGIDVKVTVDSLSFDFEQYSIDITVANTKKPKTDEERVAEALYKIDKVDTDYSKRKRNYNAMLTNFNIRNDRISAKPSNPSNLTITHKINDNGSADLTVSWNYSDYEKTKKDADNIDGYTVYMYSDVTNERYVFGSTIAKETTVPVNSTIKSYTFPSVPPNRFYTIGVQAYRSVDEDIASEGFLLSDLITPSDAEQNPYQPSEQTVVNGLLIGKVNGAIYELSDTEPENPEINKTVWTNPSTKQQLVYTENGYEPLSTGDASSVSGYPTEISDVPNSIPIRDASGYINASITGDAASVGGRRPGVSIGIATLDATANVPLTQLNNASRFASGTYVGDGTMNKLLALPFSPTTVKIYTTEATDRSLFIPSSVGGFLFGSNSVLSLPLSAANGRMDAGGFYTGNTSDTYGNKSGVTYYWEAYKA
ncbi:GH25 family lysozyme [Niallia taxi]|uniref:DUF7359 domain-containing protein n=1 Tax=Niallia taxi TaxID=2499688 RepID=UPI00317050A7